MQILRHYGDLVCRTKQEWSVDAEDRSVVGNVFILQNMHRYFFYLALVFIVFLWHDAIVSFDWDGHFGMGLGTLLLTGNVILLSLYTFSCHSLRHLAGGKLDCFSCTAATISTPVTD